MDSAVFKMIFSQEFWIMSIYWPLSLLYSYFQLLFFSSSPSYPRCSFSHDSKSKIEKPICIITGPTSGLGLAATRALVNEGYHVILVDRNSENLRQTIQDIKHKNKNSCLKSFLVDLASFQSVMNFERAFKHWLSDSDLHPSIQLLINNAGILAAESRVTCDGNDEMLETNYFGAFLLTKLLLPLLENSPIPSRIVNVSSFTHYSGVLILEAHLLQFLPRAVETRLMRELPQGLSQFAFTVLRWLNLLKSPQEGVASIIDAALAPPEVSGKYFFGGKGRTIRSSLLSYDSKLAENLWSSTDALLQESLAKNGYIWSTDR